MYKLKINAIHCMSCFRNVMDALQELDTSITADIDLKEKILSVNTERSLEEVGKVLEEAGYPITSVE